MGDNGMKKQDLPQNEKVLQQILLFSTEWHILK